MMHDEIFSALKKKEAYSSVIIFHHSVQSPYDFTKLQSIKL